jgi:hypothetical protein
MKKTILLISILLTVLSASSQSNVALNGYIKGLGMYYKPTTSIPISETDSLDFLYLNQIHNRLNFRWYASNELTFAVEAINLLFFGQLIR